jgi:ubiquinone/menaquinone biosynthesis C-methylase UbiE
MSKNDDHVWQLPEVVQKFLSGTRMALPGAAQQIEVMLKLITLNSNQVNRFLDIGCGDGILGAAILEKYPDSKGLFLDFSKDMLTAAQDKLKDFKERIELLDYDYSDPKWINRVYHLSPFDVVVSGYSIHHQPNQRKKEIYAEIYELLSTGGIFINVEHVLSRSEWIEHVHNEYFIDSLYDFKKRNGLVETKEDVSRDFYGRSDKEANILADVTEQCGWLRCIGFKDVDCYFKIFELAVFGGRK